MFSVFYCRLCALLTVFWFFPVVKVVAQQAEIFGKVFDRQTGAPLHNAQIMVLGKNIGDVAGREGIYTLSVPAGELPVVATMAGYAPDTIWVHVHPSERKQIDFSLLPRAYEIGTVTIEGARVQSGGLMDAEISAQKLHNIPMALEQEPFRAIQTMPGVIASSDFSSQLFIRGSPAAHSLIAFDGVPVYSPYHLGGVFSLFNSDGVAGVEFSPNPVYAGHGGWLGGRVNIIPRLGEHQHRTRKLYLGLLSSKASISGAWSQKATFFLAARRTYLDILGRLIAGEKDGYYFYDVQAGHTIKPAEKHVISFSAIYTRDVLGGILENDEKFLPNIEQPAWGNRILSMRWQYLANDSHKGEIQLAQSDAYMQSQTLHIDVDNLFRSRYMLATWNHFSGKHDLSFGLQIQQRKFMYGWSLQNAKNLQEIVGGNPADIFFTGAPDTFHYDVQGWQGNVFVQDELRILPHFHVLAGLRATLDGISKSIALLPRFSLRYRPRENLLLSFIAGRYVQHARVLTPSVTENFISPLGLYFPVEQDERSPGATFFALGAQLDVSILGRLKGEVYYKDMQHMPIANSSTRKITTAPMRATGLDISLDKSTGANRLTASYSLAYSLVYEKERVYFAGFDRRHSLKIAGSHKLSDWVFSWRWTLLSGLPYTEVVGRYIRLILYDTDTENDGAILGAKNAARFPAYHRLDFSCSRTWRMHKISVRVSLAVINVYNKQNPLFYTYDFSTETPTFEKIKNLPRIPTLSVQFIF